MCEREEFFVSISALQFTGDQSRALSIARLKGGSLVRISKKEYVGFWGWNPDFMKGGVTALCFRAGPAVCALCVCVSLAERLEHCDEVEFIFFELHQTLFDVITNKSSLLRQ